MALSASDQAAVLKAAQAGGDTAAQGQSVIQQANLAGQTGTIVNPTTHQAVTQMAPDAPSAASAGSGSGLTYSTSTGQFYQNGDYTKGYGLGQIDPSLSHIIGSTSDYSAGGKIQVIGDLPSAPVSAGDTQVSQTAQAQAQATQTQQTATQQQQASQATQATNPLAMPANGSVVDLLNAAGQDSSFAARSQLAAQYGIQNYSGTAAQNTQLAQKYLAAHGSLSGSAVPQNAAQAQSALNTYQNAAQTAAASDPAQAFMDAYGSLNPVEANIFQQLSTLMSSANTQQTLTDVYKQAQEDYDQQSGVDNPEIQLADINKIMDGSEQDIRDEIQNSGGFATESAVQALTTARNKTLLIKANYLQNVVSAKNDYVDNIVSLTKADRQQASDDLNQKLGIAQQLVSMSQSMDNASRQNYTQLVSQLGYTGLAQALKGNPQQMSQAERLLGLAQGTLSDPSFLSHADSGQVLGSASTGYFTRNPFSGETTPIAGGAPTSVSYGSSTGSGAGLGAGQAPVPTINGKPLTDTQSTTLGYVQRMNDANSVITQQGSSGTSGWQSFLSGIPGVGNYLTSSDYQQLQQAERNFTNAVLRKESGAAISPGEFDSASQQYFPQPGDSQAVIDQKTQNRNRAIASLSQSANVPTSYVTGQTSTSGGSYQDYLKAIGQ